MHKKVKSEKVCGGLLNCIATSQVFLLVFIDDLWFRNLTLSSVVAEPTYCTEIEFLTVGQLNDISGITRKPLLY